jgi:hypothetical protein
MSLSLLSPEVRPLLSKLAGLLEDRDFMARYPFADRRTVAYEAITVVECIALLVGLDEIEDADRIESFAREFAASLEAVR